MFKLGSLRHGRDGRLVVVSTDHRRAVAEPGGLRTLQAALEDWPHAQDAIADARHVLDEGGGEPLDTACCTRRSRGPTSGRMRAPTTST